MADGHAGGEYDLFVIGAGSGGVRAARIAAGYGAKVAIAENQALGGTCVNVGCVPKKLFVYGSHYAHDMHEASAFGWNFQPKEDLLDWKRLIQNKNNEIERLNGVYAKLLANANVELINGFATLIDANTIEVNGVKYGAKKILIAVGSRPFVPDIEGKEQVLTSNDMFYLDALPKKLLIVGGGYIAVEFACIMNGYGSEVTLAYRGDLFLRGFDKEVRCFLADQMRANGINLMFNTDLTKVEKSPDGSFAATLKDGSVLPGFDKVMYATGRVPKVETLGLENAGVKQGKKHEIIVDEWCRSSVPNIWAVGDVIEKYQLTPVAIAEGHAFADTEFGNKPRKVNYENIPTAVFSSPSIGTCGMTQEQAEEAFGADNVVVFKSAFRPLKQTLAQGVERTFLKLLVHRETDKVVGVHLVEPAAAEMVQIIGVAMKAGATKADFDNTMALHPSAAEELVTMRTPAPK
ncbi:Glutathione reductase [Porphyridium purpureum]|uniref:Glutathione reductase n=1 Tax=Porphyridium purpureum TaxID=35688 RepID=A0A5J4YS99_PORPP|nr:Glutathione reductase [Porphyridium purpureum]|eukprot:POR6965..scf229_5